MKFYKRAVAFYSFLMPSMDYILFCPILSNIIVTSERLHLKIDLESSVILLILLKKTHR